MATRDGTNGLAADAHMADEVAPTQKLALERGTAAQVLVPPALEKEPSAIKLPAKPSDGTDSSDGAYERVSTALVSYSLPRSQHKVLALAQVMSCLPACLEPARSLLRFCCREVCIPKACAARTYLKVGRHIRAGKPHAFDPHMALKEVIKHSAQKPELAALQRMTSAVLLSA